MADLSGFNADDHEVRDFEAIPAGQYTAIIQASEMKPTKAGDGAYLQLTFQVIEGAHKNRLLWARLNLDNKSKAAVDIANGELAAICRAVGIMRPKDSEDLHSKPMSIRVAQKTGTDGEVRNEIKGYRPTGGQVETEEAEEAEPEVAPAPAPKAKTKAATPAGNAGKAGMPWAKR